MIAAEAAGQARAHAKEASKQARARAKAYVAELRAEQDRKTELQARKLVELRRSETDARKSLSEAQRKIRRLEAMVKDGLKPEPLSEWKAILDSTSLAPVLQERIRSAELIEQPYPHLFIERFLPEEFHERVIAALPAADFYSVDDPVKRVFEPDAKLLPRKVALMWHFLVEDLLPQVVAPALVAKFDRFLDRHYADVFGQSFLEKARSLPQTMSRGRVMWCRPGYHQPPHLDPKRVLLSCLLYMPQGASRDERFGTQLYRVEQEIKVRYANTYYPERDGIECTLEKTVPYRENALLVFLNSGGAHGVDLSPDSAPADFHRYLFQFYIAPQQEALDDLIATLPEDRQREWQDRSR